MTFYFYPLSFFIYLLWTLYLNYKEINFALPNTTNETHLPNKAFLILYKLNPQKAIHQHILYSNSLSVDKSSIGKWRRFNEYLLVIGFITYTASLLSTIFLHYQLDILTFPLIGFYLILSTVFMILENRNHKNKVRKKYLNLVPILTVLSVSGIVIFSILGLFRNN